MKQDWDTVTPPDLENRFTKPDGWQWDIIKRPFGHIRYGHVIPENCIGHIMICPGLREHGETYFELARDLLTEGYAVWTIDWRGQGLSTRYFKDHYQVRHSEGFQNDIDDLSNLIDTIVKPAANDKPLYLFSHSMGGNLATRYLIQHPDTFHKAVLSAPMFGIYALRRFPRLVVALIFKIAKNDKIHGVGDKWSPAFRNNPLNDIYSSDPVRKKVPDAWFQYNEKLRMAPQQTYGWIKSAHASCVILRKTFKLKTIKTPMLIAIAGKEVLVDNTHIRTAANHIPNCTLIEFPNAKHELWLEQDHIRTPFLQQSLDFLKN